jgi:hypothetical protein
MWAKATAEMDERRDVKRGFQWQPISGMRLILHLEAKSN